MDAPIKRVAVCTLLFLPLLILTVFLGRHPFVLVLWGGNNDSSLEAAISTLANDYGLWTPFICISGALTGYAAWKCIDANENHIADANMTENDAPLLFLNLRRLRNLWLTVAIALGSVAFLSSFGAHEVLQELDNPIWPTGTGYIILNNAPGTEDKEPWRAGIVLDTDLQPVIYRSAWLRTAIALNRTDDRIPDDSRNPKPPPPYADRPGRVNQVVYPSMRTGGFGLSTHMLNIPGFLNYEPLPPGADPLQRRVFRGTTYSHASGPRFVSLDAVVMRTNISVDCVNDTANWSIRREYTFDGIQIFTGERRPRRGGYRENYFFIYHLRNDPVVRMKTWMQEDVDEGSGSKGVHQIIVLTLVNAPNAPGKALVLDCKYGGNDVVTKAVITDPSKPIIPGDEFISCDKLSYWILWAAAKRINSLLGWLLVLGEGDGGVVAKAMIDAGIDKAMRKRPFDGYGGVEVDMAPLLSDILTDAAQGFYSLLRQEIEVSVWNRDRETPLGHSTLRYISQRVGRGTRFGPGMLLTLWIVCLVSCARTAMVTSGTAGNRDRAGIASGEREGYRILDGGDSDSESDGNSSPED